jgi:beta-lactam-binding protein with PASTA domain
MSFFSFLRTKIFLKDFGIAIATFLVIIIISLWSLDIYTQNGDSIAVPDFKGLSIAEVEKLADDNSLEFEITDSVYLKTAKKGAVVEQNPSPNFKVKEGRKIFLTVNAINDEKVQMPKLVGITLRQATSTLETYGLRIGRISYAPDIAKNVVLNQRYKGKEIKPNSLVIKGDAIDLVLGMGESDEKTSVPSLIGIAFTDVEELLNQSSLNLGSVVCDETIVLSSDSAKSKIWKQIPVANSEITLGSSIDIWITTNASIINTANETINAESEFDF